MSSRDCAEPRGLAPGTTCRRGSRRRSSPCCRRWTGTCGPRQAAGRVEQHRVGRHQRAGHDNLDVEAEAFEAQDSAEAARHRLAAHRFCGPQPAADELVLSMFDATSPRERPLPVGTVGDPQRGPHLGHRAWATPAVESGESADGPAGSTGQAPDAPVLSLPGTRWTSPREGLPEPREQTLCPRDPVGNSARYPSSSWKARACTSASAGHSAAPAGTTSGVTAPPRRHPRPPGQSDGYWSGWHRARFPPRAWSWAAMAVLVRPQRKADDLRQGVDGPRPTGCHRQHHVLLRAEGFATPGVAARLSPWLEPVDPGWPSRGGVC
jgi:hypothetical protein